MSKSKKKGDKGELLDSLQSKVRERWRDQTRELLEEKPRLEQAPKPKIKKAYKEGDPIDPTVRVGSKHRAPEPRQNHNWGKRLTGQWRDTNQTYHMFINHAGEHIELLFASLVVDAVDNDPSVDTKRCTTQLLRMGGDRIPDYPRTYLLYVHVRERPIDDKNLLIGTLEHDPAVDKFKLDLDTGVLSTRSYNEKLVAKLAAVATSGAKRIGSMPNYFENHLGPHPSGKRGSVVARTAMWFLTTPKQANRMRQHIFDARVRVNPENYLLLESGGKSVGYVALLDAFYAVRDDKDIGAARRKQRMKNVAAALDELVQVAWFDACKLPVEHGGISIHDAGLWRAATLQALADRWHSIAGDKARNLLTHTQAILDASPNQPNFDKRLGLARHAGGHAYAASIRLTNAQGALKDAARIGKMFKWSRNAARRALKKLNKLHGVVMWGSLVVENQGKKHPFHGEYFIWQFGYTTGAAFGDSATVVASTGKAEHVYGQAWRPEHIPGSADLVELGVSFTGGPSGTGLSGTNLRIEGSGASKPPTPLNLNFSGLSDLASLTGFGLGLDFLRTGGEISALGDEEGGDVLPNLPDPPDDEVYGYEATGKLHFPINGAKLEAPAKILLEIFAACELVTLGQKGLKLEVHGYADQPDNPIKNEILSRNRAISVYHFLKNILEDDLAAGDLPPTPSEDEELKQARRAEERQEDFEPANASTRQVQIIAHGEPESSESEPDKKPTYNPNLRRVDLIIDNEITVVLCRDRDAN